jgi:uncharacterized protein YceH (UPF0502 family)
MNLDEEQVRDALGTLQEKRLAGPAGGADSRVTKYEHRLQEVFNFTRPEIAIVCVLLLRGPQTPGELRGRTERMYRFDALEDVQSGLQRLIEHDPPLAAMLPRQPGTKEARYAHLFSGEVEHVQAVSPPVSHRDTDDSDRLATMEEELAGLRREVADLRQQLEGFRRQFD